MLKRLRRPSLLGAQTYLPLNQGQAVGRLRILNQAEGVNDLQPRDIVLLREVPISLPPVAGVVTERPSTVLSHVNLLARGWGIPNAYVQKPPSITRTSTAAGCISTFSPPALRCAPPRLPNSRARSSRHCASLAKGSKVLLQPDLRRSELVPLAGLRSADRRRCGAKAANLARSSPPAWRTSACPMAFAFRLPPMPTSCAPTA